MEPHRPHYTEYGIAVLVSILLASFISYIEITRPSLQQVGDFLRLDQVKTAAHTEAPSPSPSPQPSTSPTPSPTPTPSATPSPTPTPTPAAATAATNSFAHMRAGKGTNTAIITDLNAGTTVTLGNDADATWQAITYQGKAGYIYKAYLTY